MRFFIKHRKKLKSVSGNVKEKYSPLAYNLKTNTDDSIQYQKEDYSVLASDLGPNITVYSDFDDEEISKMLDEYDGSRHR